MTDVDMDRLPPAVRKSVERLDDRIAELTREVDLRLDEQKLLSHRRSAILETAAVFLEAADAARNDHGVTVTITQNAPEPAASPHRRNIRGEVLALLTETGRAMTETGRAMTEDEIARALAGSDPISQSLKLGVERALSYHAESRRVEPVKSLSGDDRWRIVTASVAAEPEAATGLEAPSAPPSPSPIDPAPVSEQPAAPPPHAKVVMRAIGKTEEQTYAAVLNAGDMGLGRGQLALLSIADETIDALEQAGRVVKFNEGHGDRWRAVTTPAAATPFNPLEDIRTPDDAA